MHRIELIGYMATQCEQLTLGISQCPISVTQEPKPIVEWKFVDRVFCPALGMSHYFAFSLDSGDPCP